MKTLIFDPTPLIYLTRVGLLHVIEAIPTRKFTSRSVFREVVESGKAKGLADALALQHAFEAGVIEVEDPQNQKLLRTLMKIRGLEEPDAETLAIAKERNYRAVIDDLLARKAAKTYSIDFVGTIYILITGIRGQQLTKQEGAKAVDEMIEAGWRCGPELYREITGLLLQS